jgi:hypothetical protein
MKIRVLHHVMGRVRPTLAGALRQLHSSDGMVLC